MIWRFTKVEPDLGEHIVAQTSQTGLPAKLVMEVTKEKPTR